MRKRPPAAALLLIVITVSSLLVLVRSRGSKDSTPPQATVSETSSIVEEQMPRAVETDLTQVVPTTAQRIARVVVPSLGIDAPTVVLGVTSDGTMQAPATPTDIGWYNFSSMPNGGGNVVLSGHVDYVNYGPAVFWKLRDVHLGDVVHVLLVDQSVVTYKVTTISNYDSDKAPLKEIIGKTPVETLTLITCDGSFNSRTHEYDKRLVVRAVRA
jgi:LPXTG-site transpeptidase (sortase) family protein